MPKLLTLVSGLALSIGIASAAVAEPVKLTAAQMDKVTAGEATATLTVTNLSASGPTSATATAAGVRVTAATTGGAAPSNTATVGGTFTASSR